MSTASVRMRLVQDVVTREGKLLFLYKRPGQRVIVNAAGHVMVRPTHMEASVQKSTGGMPISSRHCQQPFSVMHLMVHEHHLRGC